MGLVLFEECFVIKVQTFQTTTLNENLCLTAGIKCRRICQKEIFAVLYLSFAALPLTTLVS